MLHESGTQQNIGYEHRGALANWTLQEVTSFFPNAAVKVRSIVFDEMSEY